jgi:hypothetical protein
LHDPAEVPLLAEFVQKFTLHIIVPAQMKTNALRNRNVAISKSSVFYALATMRPIVWTAQYTRI